MALSSIRVHLLLLGLLWSQHGDCSRLFRPKQITDGASNSSPSIPRLSSPVKNLVGQQQQQQEQQQHGVSPLQFGGQRKFGLGSDSPFYGGRSRGSGNFQHDFPNGERNGFEKDLEWYHNWQDKEYNVEPQGTMQRPVEADTGKQRMNGRFDAKDATLKEDNRETMDYFHRDSPPLEINSGGNPSVLQAFLDQFYLIKTPYGYILGRTSNPTHSSLVASESEEPSAPAKSSILSRRQQHPTASIQENRVSSFQFTNGHEGDIPYTNKVMGPWVTKRFQPTRLYTKHQSKFLSNEESQLKNLLDDIMVENGLRQPKFGGKYGL